MESKKKVDDEVNNFQREMSWLPGKKNEALEQSFNIKLFNTENPFLNNQVKEEPPSFQTKSISLEEIKSLNFEFYVIVHGNDGTFSQTIYDTHRYLMDSILENHYFVDVLQRLDDGTRVIDFKKFHQTIPNE